MSEQSDENSPVNEASPAHGPVARLRYYAVEACLEAYYFVYGLFFASTKKDVEDEDERWRARKRRP